MTVDRTDKNRQAVGEFQGQRMDKDDLTSFFKNEVPGFQAGDDQVSKFAGGEEYVKGTGIEARRDNWLPPGARSIRLTRFALRFTGAAGHRVRDGRGARRED